MRVILGKLDLCTATCEYEVPSTVAGQIHSETAAAAGNSQSGTAPRQNRETPGLFMLLLIKKNTATCCSGTDLKLTEPFGKLCLAVHNLSAPFGFDSTLKAEAHGSPSHKCAAVVECCVITVDCLPYHFDIFYSGLQTHQDLLSLLCTLWVGKCVGMETTQDKSTTPRERWDVVTQALCPLPQT